MYRTLILIATHMRNEMASTVTTTNHAFELTFNIVFFNFQVKAYFSNIGHVV